MKNTYFRIADHVVRISTDDSMRLSTLIPSFGPFLCAECEPLITVNVTIKDTLADGEGDRIGEFDSGFGTYIVWQTATGYVIRHMGHGLPTHQIVANHDFTVAEAQLVSPQYYGYGISNAVMLVFAFAAASHQTLMIHSSVVRNVDCAYLFLGPSGTGKSTHTSLWRSHIPGSDLVNDDNPILRFIDGKTYVYGSPWSGKTPCYRSVRFPVAGITRLEQAPENEIRRVEVLEALSVLITSVSNMRWDKRVNNAILATIGVMIGDVPIFHLRCLPDADAARLSFSTISALWKPSR
ncbi:MAG: hypothetical protein HUK01_02835 [Bacteroidaceae bacterium]|nr:hypothetical protein [Bacteroidaceae bacterium]